MSFLLKIVEGPNKGAEIALVEGVAVTLGKGDDCDIVLVDKTMPDEPLKVEASADGVAVDGASLEPFLVKTVGATSFAIGPADSPWGALKWPEDKESDDLRREAETHGEEPKDHTDAEKGERRSGEDEGSGSDSATMRDGKKKRGGCCGCIVALVVLLMLMACLFCLFGDRVGESDRLAQFEKIGRGWYSRLSGAFGGSGESGQPVLAATLSDVASKYGLSLVESNDVTRMFGNLRTRRERLSATAEAYQAQPGVELDLSDDESFRMAAEDALFTLSEGALTVAAATNRFLSIVGSSSSTRSLKKTLKALSSDLPKLRNVDVSGVVIGVVKNTGHETMDGEQEESQTESRISRLASKKASSDLPVCGILTMPYPCLVMRDGRRIMEGGTIGTSVIVEIGADSVVLTNSTGRFTWKP